MFAAYHFEPGIEIIADCVQKGFKNEDYFWVPILTYYLKGRKYIEPTVRKLNGKIPDNFLGIVYLDWCNIVVREDETFRPHPFATSEGIQYIENYLHCTNEDEFDRALTAAGALAFLPQEITDKLLPLALNHLSYDVRMEGLYCGTRIGNDDCKKKLLAIAEDVRYSWKAVEFLKELGLENEIPPKSQEPEFLALTEMVQWLAYPTEFGAIPDEISIVDSRTLYWRHAKEKRTLYIVRYKYNKWKTDGTDETGVGLVGSGTTFCLFDNTLESLSPEEIYSVHCAWELELDDYENPKTGLAILKQDNPGFAKDFDVPTES
jgi:hypothetical protein